MEQTLVWFGNTNPQMTEHVRDEQGTVIAHVQRPARHLNQSVTRIDMRPEFDAQEHVELTLSTDNDRALVATAARLGDEHRLYAVGVHEVESIVQVHAAGDSPAWVASTDPAFAAALAKHFGCPANDAPEGIAGPTALLTLAGRDAMHDQTLKLGSQPTAFVYGALSANSGSGFATTDTTLAGEITTAGGGLLRKQMTYAHTTGTNTSTLTATWTANGSDALPVVVATWANFNATPTGGTIDAEELLNATATVTISGDSLTVTFTLTLG